MTNKNITDILLFWPSAKDKFYELFMELYDLAGLEDTENIARFISELGHPGRSFYNFPKTIPLNALEISNYYKDTFFSNLETEIDAPNLIYQLSKIILDYESTLMSPLQNPKRPESLKKLAEKTQGFYVELGLRKLQEDEAYELKFCHLLTKQ